MAKFPASRPLLVLLLQLLKDHCAREATFNEAEEKLALWNVYEHRLQVLRRRQHELPRHERLPVKELQNKAKKTLGRRAEALPAARPDAPVMDETPWKVAIHWLAERSRFFHDLDSDDNFADPKGADPIDEYERVLRSYLANARRGRPIRANKAAAELLEFEREGLFEGLKKELKTQFPDIDKRLPNVNSKKRRRGRPSDTDHEVDRRLAEAWKTGRYRTLNDLAKAKGISKREVYLALERHRSRCRRLR